MKIKHLLSFLFLGFLLVFWNSCKEKEDGRYPGFDVTEQGVYFKRVTIGDGTKLVNSKDSVYLQLRFEDSLGTVLYNSNQGSAIGILSFVIPEKNSNSFFENAIRTMTEGDSTIFIIKADSLYKQSFNLELPNTIKPGTLLKVFAQLYKHVTEKEIEFNKIQYQHWSKEMLDVENAYLKEYFTKNKITQLPDSNGIIVLSFSRGSGQTIFNYPSVLVNYRGQFLDGKEIDNSYSAGQALEYVPGNPGQMLPGIELMLANMKIGGKAKIILPSQLAFGARGSTNGQVPPFTPVIYEIEITDHN